MISEAALGLLGIVSTGTIAWAYNLGTKVSALEQANDDFKEFMKELLDAKFEPINQRLSRIESAMNGHLKGH